MAKQGRAPKRAASPSEVQLVGSSEVVAMYADVFVVVNEGETGLGSLYFYQRQLSDRNVELGEIETTTGAFLAAKAKCIGRVLLSQQGVGKLLEALADNRGFTLTPKVKEKK